MDQIEFWDASGLRRVGTPMKYWLLVCGCCLGCSVASADVTVIYRTADQVVCGWVHPPQAVETELTNCTKSELGGQVSDYTTVVVTDENWKANQGRDVTVTPSGKVVFMPNVLVEKRKTDRASAMTKLRALGLTADEVDALK